MAANVFDLVRFMQHPKILAKLPFKNNFFKYWPAYGFVYFIISDTE